MLFKFFEKSVPCYPSNEPALPPRGFLAFFWACARGVRGYVVAMAGLSALIAVYEALLFAVLLGLGVALQALSVYRSSSNGLRCALLGAALVVGAGLFDRDPVLVVGQIVLVAALWPVAAKKFCKSGSCPGSGSGPGSGPGAAQRSGKAR